MQPQRKQFLLFLSFFTLSLPLATEGSKSMQNLTTTTSLEFSNNAPSDKNQKQNESNIRKNDQKQLYDEESMSNEHQAHVPEMLIVDNMDTSELSTDSARQNLVSKSAEKNKHNISAESFEPSQSQRHQLDDGTYETQNFVETEEEYILADVDDEKKLIHPNEQKKLEEKIKSMTKEQVEEKIKKVISKANLNTQKFAEQPIAKQLETGLVISRYFYIKKNYSKELLNLVGFLQCNLEFTAEEREYQAYTMAKGKQGQKITKKLLEPIVQIRRDGPIDPDFQYRFSYDVVTGFSESYGEYCRQADNFLEPLKRLLYEFQPNEKQKDGNIDLESFLGRKIEKLIREQEKQFNEFARNVFEMSTDMLNKVKNIDCNLKEMMAFYDLLPRFFLLYKRIKEKLENMEDPVVDYYRQQFVEVHAKWLQVNNELFGYIGAFNVWLILNQGLFKMPFSFPKDDYFKITMIEMMAKSMIELTLEKDRYRTAIRNIIFKYKDVYDQLRVCFEGLEEYLYIKVPFQFPSLGKGKSNGGGKLAVVWGLVSVLLLWVRY